MSLVLDNRTPISRYRPRIKRPELNPLPPQWEKHEYDPARSPLVRFVLLSMVLHALLIVLFGAPTGGSREGRAMWGALNVVLRGPPIVLDAPRASLPREAPAARPVKAADPIVVPEAPVGAPIKELISFPPLIDRIKPVDRNIDLPPPLVVPPPTDALFVAPATRDLKTAPQIIAAPPIIPAPPVPERTPAVPIAPRIVAPPVAAPLVQPILPTVPDRLRTTPAERNLVESPTITAVPVAPAVQLRPVETATIPVPATPSVVPLQMDPAPTIQVSPAIRPAYTTPAATAPSAPAAPARAEPPAAQPEPSAARTEPMDRPLPRDDAAARASPSRPAPPSPDALLRREPNSSSNYDPTKGAPSLDPDAMRRRAAQMAKEGTGNRALLPFAMPQIPDRKSKMEEAIEKARKPDCKDAYKSLGLLAVVPLVANEFGEGTCRW